MGDQVLGHHVLAAQEDLEVGQCVAAPEHLVAHHHGRHAEDACGDRGVGLRAKPRLRGVRLGLVEQRLRIEAA